MDAIGPNWLRVAAAGDVAEGERLAVTVGTQRILLLRRDGVLYAVENECPHLGCTFDRGRFEGYALTCPCHDWTFDIRTGAFVFAPEIALHTWRCRETATGLWIDPGGEPDA